MRPVNLLGAEQQIVEWQGEQGFDLRYAPALAGGGRGDGGRVLYVGGGGGHCDAPFLGCNFESST